MPKQEVYTVLKGAGRIKLFAGEGYWVDMVPVLEKNGIFLYARNAQAGGEFTL